MNLMELKPKASVFTIKAAKRSFKMNPINLSDEVWLEETYGSEKLQKIFKEIDIREIARIVYRLIDVEDKKFFKQRTVTFISETGEEYEEELGGLNLLVSMIVGNEDKLAILMALIDNMGASRPDVNEDIPDKKKAVKKKAKKKVKKK